MANVTLNVTDAKGQATGTVEAPEALFGVSAEDVQAHIPLIHQVVTAQLAAARQGTHATKTRGMVSGGGKKPWKQKGTGRARQGSIRAPQWYHGGTVFGPQPRDYSQRTPKKMKAAALRYALSDRGQYTFVVAPNANKVQIKQAIEEIFKVKVTNVNTLNRAGKKQRTRTGFGQRASQKRAIVTVAEGQTIDIFGN